MKKNYSRYIQVAALVIASAIYVGLQAFNFSDKASAKEDYYYVTRVVDGDTLKFSNNSRVRLIGVDTPEIHYSQKLERDARKAGVNTEEIRALGRQSSDFTKKLCIGKKARLEFDVEKKDRYGRTLAYVFLEDGTFVNARILEEGYGQVMTIPPNVKYAEYFLKLQQDARRRSAGLWKK